MKSIFRLFVLAFIIPLNLYSFDVKELQTKKGIKFWFVEDKSIPIISLSFSFSGGAFFDKPGKEGTSSLLASLLDEGAGNLDSVKF